ncbi:MAG: GNAT family N-acetyltransferase [Verrucomicrobia bacterium]|nr:GNAT family N-acetyltransferase [Verrucomicrobiota bacterium]
MESLILRQWDDSDLELYTAMNSDSEVMRHFPSILSSEESLASFQKLRRAIDERGWGLWAVDVDGVFAGFTGLNIPTFSAPFTPCTEIGWRFRREYWGRGLATRAARKALDFGFETLKLHEIVSFTAATNVRSRRLMERLGLEWDTEGDFQHPAIPDGHVLRPHVLYRGRANKADAHEPPPRASVWTH